MQSAYIRSQEAGLPPKSGEVERFRDQKKVLVDMGSDAFRERLRELREQSKEVNRALEEELQSRRLPFSTQRTHNGAVRFVVELRPEFFQTDKADEAAGNDRAENRYAVQDDQITVFLHVQPDGSLDIAPRFRSNLDSPRYDFFISELFSRVENIQGRRKRRFTHRELSEALQKGDPVGISRFVADSLANTTDAQGFSGAERVNSMDEARQYFANALIFPLRDAPIVRNASRMALRSLLESQAGQTSASPAGAERFIDVAEDLQAAAEQFLDIPVNVMDETGKVHTVRDYIAYGKGNSPEDAVRDMVTDVLKRYKAQIYGWKN